MLFQRKVDRAMEWSKKRRQEADGLPLKEDGTVDEDRLPSMEELQEVSVEQEMEKGDLSAMILSGCLTILPIAILILVVFAAIGYFMVGGF